MVFQELLCVSNPAVTALDVGCGPSDLLCRLIKERKNKGIGLDPLRPSLKNCKDRIEGSKISERMELIRGVSEWLPIKDDCLNLCVMTEALDHVYSPSQTFKEIHRVLVPEGYFVLLQSVVSRRQSSFDDITHLHEFTLADLEWALRSFTIEKIKRFHLAYLLITRWRDFLPDALDYVRQLILPTPVQTQPTDEQASSGAIRIYEASAEIRGFIDRLLNYSETLIICKKSAR
jgi:ubiquinone/menaquinone biosynthesis C-methylase UbiE